MAQALMILGTASHVGKSLITAAICRILARRGLRVAPFKAQNMSLNSAATVDGYEIGRAQALQAEAAGIFATREMNPILLKPDSDSSCQVVVNGRVWDRLTASEYHTRRVEELFPLVVDSYRRLARDYEIVVLEGAGSPAEINLKAHDIVNMRMAEAADAACLLVGDIDRGGVFASLLGTLELLTSAERRRIHGFIINKFRGDIQLLEPGIRQIEERLAVPCIGVVPFIPQLHLDDEDSVSLEDRRQRPEWRYDEDDDNAARWLRVAVVALPYLSNFTDFDALASEPSLSLHFVDKPSQLAMADVVILPGTKQTIHDFHWLRQTGLADAIQRHCRAGKIVCGICGGMQMMGQAISDPHGMEGGGDTRALEFLPFRTTLAREKVTAQAEAELLSGSLLGIPCGQRRLMGYEIHLGETCLEAGVRPLFRLRRLSQMDKSHLDGMESPDGLSFGTYLHGLFDQDDFRHLFIACARKRCRLSEPVELASYSVVRHRELDRLANTVEQSLDMPFLYRCLGIASADRREGMACRTI